MTDPRTERLLRELASRYDLTKGFLRQLRPAVTTILSDEISEDDRIMLLEELAQTCQRDQQSRSSTVAQQSSMPTITDAMSRLVVRLMQARGAKR